MRRAVAIALMATPLLGCNQIQKEPQIRLSVSNVKTTCETKEYQYLSTNFLSCATTADVVQESGPKDAPIQVLVSYTKNGKGSDADENRLLASNCIVIDGKGQVRVPHREDVPKGAQPKPPSYEFKVIGYLRWSLPPQPSK